LLQSLADLILHDLLIKVIEAHLACVGLALGDTCLQLVL
jgi:hypothetical protein